jgi:hypothetical protein
MELQLLAALRSTPRFWPYAPELCMAVEVEAAVVLHPYECVGLHRALGLQALFTGFKVVFHHFTIWWQD